jgi:regulator of protease activity HflC (stomatin/prohibitin superfamily)
MVINKSIKKQKITSYLRNISIIVLLFLFVVVLFSSKIFIKIKSGKIGVLYDLIDGTQPGLYTEGLKIISPLNEMFIYDLRTEIIKGDQTVLSHNGLKIDIKYYVLFKPLKNEIQLLHQNFGPEYVSSAIIPATESATRRFIADLTPEDIFLIDKGVLEQRAIDALKKELRTMHIDMEGFYISEINLPDTISNAIEARFKEQEIVYQYDFKLEVEEKERKRKTIEAEGIKQFQLITNISPLQWKALDVTEKISKSPNSKIIMMGNSSKDLPILLNNDTKK